MKKLAYLLFSAIMLIGLNSNAQELKLLWIAVQNEQEDGEFLTAMQGKDITIENVMEFYLQLPSEYNVELYSVSEETDDTWGQDEYRLYYNDIEVYGARLVVAKQKDEVILISGRYTDVANVETDPLITLDQAVEVACADMGCEQDSVNVDLKDGQEFYLFATTDTTLLLSYIFYIGQGIQETLFTIDARTGSILAKNNAIIYAGLQETQDQQISAYPNPAKDIITITGVDDNQEVAIFNSLGQQVLQTQGKQIDIKSLDKGIYLIRVENRTAKFIKE